MKSYTRTVVLIACDLEGYLNYLERQAWPVLRVMPTSPDRRAFHVTFAY